MASNLFQHFRKELITPLTRQNVRFNGNYTNSNNLTDTEKRVRTVFKVLAAFLPGMYVGHLLTKHGVFSKANNGKQEKNVDDAGEMQKTNGDDAGEMQKTNADDAKPEEKKM
ncbi:hypothetical protein CDAR_490021 [Caerostris darwini]|uniref:Uncharacterized protein n=1 Tax=Caerostris darwini TaxID=1538125 RepID=A0AAV4TNU6_9ARAC|nr:hypothetical protein CDAR_490021 [Caerostris darwini]